MRLLLSLLLMVAVGGVAVARSAQLARPVGKRFLANKYHAQPRKEMWLRHLVALSLMNHIVIKKMALIPNRRSPLPSVTHLRSWSTPDRLSPLPSVIDSQRRMLLRSLSAKIDPELQLATFLALIGLRASLGKNGVKGPQLVFYDDGMPSRSGSSGHPSDINRSRDTRKSSSPDEIPSDPVDSPPVDDSRKATSSPDDVGKGKGPDEV